MIDRKKRREAARYTQPAQNKSPFAWLRLAHTFHAAAVVLHDNANLIPSDSRPFALNAGYSLELLFKGLLVQDNKPIPTGRTGHDLVALSELVGLSMSEEQNVTLATFSEVIVWLGRYPAPNQEGRWDHYHDVIYEKNVIRELELVEGQTTYSVRANPATFANWDNYNRIWSIGSEKVRVPFKTESPLP
jgi:hypothetical protein